MKYIKTYEDLGFDLEETKLGREVYIIMSDDEKYYYDYDNYVSGRMNHIELKSVSELTVGFLNQRGIESFKTSKELQQRIIYVSGSASDAYKFYLPEGDYTIHVDGFGNEFKEKEPYPPEKLKNVKWFVGGVKV